MLFRLGEDNTAWMQAQTEDEHELCEHLCYLFTCIRCRLVCNRLPGTFCPRCHAELVNEASEFERICEELDDYKKRGVYTGDYVWPGWAGGFHSPAP